MNITASGGVLVGQPADTSEAPVRGTSTTGNSPTPLPGVTKRWGMLSVIPEDKRGEVPLFEWQLPAPLKFTFQHGILVDDKDK
jgi:hypothetical protein